MHRSQRVIRWELSGSRLYLPLLLPMPQLPRRSSCRPSLSRGLLQSWVPSKPDSESDAGEEEELLCLQALNSPHRWCRKCWGATRARSAGGVGAAFHVFLNGQSPTEWSPDPQAKHSPLAIGSCGDCVRASDSIHIQVAEEEAETVAWLMGHQYI